MLQNNVVVYHDPCTDGFGAAWAMHISHAGGFVERWVKGKYNEHLPIWDGDKSKDLYILDFSVPPEQLAQLCGLYGQVFWLDHHVSAIKAWEKYLETNPKPTNLTTDLDINRSGAGIAWDFFHPPIPRLKLINYIEDRDLWRFKLLHSKEINEVIQATEYSFKAFTELSEDLDLQFTAMTTAGAWLLKKKKIQVQHFLDHCTRPFAISTNKDTPDEYTHKGLCANCPALFASEVGNELAKISGTFGGTYWANSRGEIEWSLRSIGDYDVSRIAGFFGGGGHKNAAGFRLVNQESRPDGVSLWTT